MYNRRTQDMETRSMAKAKKPAPKKPAKSGFYPKPKSTKKDGLGSYRQ